MRFPFAHSPALHAAMAGLLLVGALAGCNRAEPPAAPPAASGTDTAPAPSPDATDAGDAMVTMRYACGDQRVAVFGNDHATVTMDGRDVDLAHVADSSPPRFSGEGLEFSIAADGAMLARDGEAGRACTAE